MKRLLTTTIVLVLMFIPFVSSQANVGPLHTTDDNVWITDTYDSNRISAMAIESNNYLWTATQGGAVRWNVITGNYGKHSTADGLVSNYVGSENSKLNQTTWRTYSAANGLANNWVNAIAVDSAGNKWFGTDWGVSKFDGLSWTTYTTADGLVNNIVTAVAIDRKGNKWFGTGGGVSKFNGTTWATYTANDGLAANIVNAIAVDRKENKWFGTDCCGVSKFDGKTWTTYTTADGLASDTVKSIASDRTGDIWFGTGADWFGREGGVSKFDGTIWTTYTTANGLVNNEVNAIAIDQAGNKWFGTGDWSDMQGGVSKFDGTSWTNYTAADGLASYVVNAIAVDGAGVIWFGTSGVSKYDGESWTTYTAADGLASNYVNTIAIDGIGHKWFGTDNGVSEMYETHPPTLTLNYTSGAPGSFFNVTGSHFATNQTYQVLVNGTHLGQVTTSADGAFGTTLATTQADAGNYFVTVSQNTTGLYSSQPAQTEAEPVARFNLDATAPLRARQGSYTQISVPVGIAFTYTGYLPLAIGAR